MQSCEKGVSFRLCYHRLYSYQKLVLTVVMWLNRNLLAKPEWLQCWHEHCNAVQVGIMQTSPRKCLSNAPGMLLTHRCVHTYINVSGKIPMPTQSYTVDINHYPHSPCRVHQTSHSQRHRTNWTFLSSWIKNVCLLTRVLKFSSHVLSFFWSIIPCYTGI